MDFLVRIASLVKKELLAVLRDKKKPDGFHYLKAIGSGL